MLDKQQLRAKFRKIRDSIPIGEREVSSRLICENIKEFITLTKSKNIGLYYPINSEVNITPLLYTSSCNICLPQIDSISENMIFVKFEENNLQNNIYGIPEPKFTQEIQLDSIFVPALVLDLHGNRVGYGKGYYDKYLDKIKKANKLIYSIGVCFECQIYDNLIPSNDFDIKLDFIITEKKIINIKK